MTSSSAQEEQSGCMHMPGLNVADVSNWDWPLGERFGSIAVGIMRVSMTRIGICELGIGRQ